MRVISKLLLVFSLAGFITACPETTTAVGKLEVNIIGLPSGNANVTVTGPGGFSQALTGTKTLTDLTPGQYAVAATNVVVGGTSYGATVTGSPATVTAGGSSSVSVVYGTLRAITGKVINGAGKALTTASLLGTDMTVKLLGSTEQTLVVPNGGGFTLNNVPAKYSLVVLISNQYGRSATVYQDLTREDPTLTILQGQFGDSTSPGPTSSTSVAGKITGGSGFNATSTAETTVALAFPKAVNVFSSSFFSINPITGDYSTGGSWLGNNTPVDATLHALQFSTDANGKITAYSGYGQQPVTLTPQGPVDPGQPIPTPFQQDVALKAVTTGNAKGAITWPNGLISPQYQISTTLQFSDSSPANLPLLRLNSVPSTLNTAPTAYDQLVPMIAGSKLFQRALITGSSSQSSPNAAVKSVIWKPVTPGSVIDLVVPAPIGLTSPAPGANTITKNTNFSWDTYPNGIYVLSTIGPVQSQNPIRIQVVTAKASSTVPDLGAEFGLLKNTSYGWNVEAIGPYSSIDAATGTGGLILPNIYSGSFLPVSDIGYATAASRLFTTAP
jgi:hypothetical protein